MLLRCNSYSFASLLLWDKRDALIYSTWCCGHRGPSISKHNLFSNKISINKNKQIYLKSATKLCSITTAAPPARSKPNSQSPATITNVFLHLILHTNFVHEEIKVTVNISRNNYVLTFWKLIYIVFSAIHLSCSPKTEEVFAVRTLTLR